jgi:hypothetical protein
MQLLKIASRKYFCPTCGNEEMHSTNHQGEIYCHCKKCHSSPLYCAEIDAHAGLPFRTAVLHCYRFYLENEDERQAYHALRAQLEGVHCHEVLMLGGEFAAESKHDGKTVKLFNPETWPDQFVSDIGRLHRWKQYVVENPRVKMGYWLELIA